MHKLMEFILVLVFAAAGSTYPISFDDSKATADRARAQELLAQARNALGGDAKVKAVQSLAVTGSFRRVLGPQMPESSGEFEIELLLPDKFKRTENMSLMGGAAQVTRIDGFNGDQHFYDSSSSGGMVMIRRPGGDAPAMQASQLRALKADAARHLIAWLLHAPDVYQIDFTYAGEAEAAEGKADVLDAKGANGFAAKIFLDKQSHRPLMISYRAIMPRMVMRAGGEGISREDAEKRAKEIEKEAHAEMEKNRPEESEIQMFLSDYKAVDGIQLPHRIARSVNGEVNEEWEVKKFKLNPPLKAERFKK